MQVTLCREPFEYIIIDNTYTEEELRLIFLELDFWALSGNLMGPEKTATAVDENNQPKKKNRGAFLDELYADRAHSNILKLNRKLYKIQLNEPSILLEYMRAANRDLTLISYYENHDYYGSHQDDFVVTALTYLYRQPKAFEGGDLALTRHGYVFEPWFNRTYIMPSVIDHAALEVKMKPEDCGKGLGRFCISNFMYKQHRE